MSLLYAFALQSNRFLLTDIPKSDTFDVTLIITLLRNLGELTDPVKGYDHLPGSTETSPASDLARIKYYRNYIAHLENCKINNTFFSTSWEDISEVCMQSKI